MENLKRAVEQREDAGKIFNLSEKVLQSSPQDAFAIHCKAVSLLHAHGSNVQKLATAIECFDILQSQVAKGSLTAQSIPSVLGLPNISALVFQHAYALYRLNRFNDVISLLRAKGVYAADTDEFPSANLLAQAYYNTEAYEEAAQMYEQLLTEAEDDEDQGHILTNLTACYAALGDTKRCEKAVRKADQKLFEHLLNSAIAATQSEDIESAKVLLNQAEQLLRRDAEANGATIVTLEGLENTTASDLARSAANKDFASDFALLLIQRAFIAQFYDADIPLAEKLLSLIVDLRIGSQISASIASVNIATIKNHSHFFDAYRTLKQVQTPSVFNRFNRHQRRAVQFNTALLLLNMNKMSESKHIADQLTQEHSDWSAVPLLWAALLVADKRMSPIKAEAELRRRFGATNATRLAVSKSLSLAVAQIRLRAGDVAGAAAVLEADTSLASHSSVVATLCDLYSSSGLLGKAAKVLSTQQANSKSNPAVLRVAESLIQSGRPDEALELLDSVKLTSNESNALRTLAASSRNVALAQALSAKLDISSSLSLSQKTLSEDDITALVSKLPNRQDLETKGYIASANANESQKRTNRRRPMRHPCKNLKPDAKIDYERWLPLSIRTYYKDLPERRKKEMRRLRREEQAVKRKLAEKRKAETSTTN